MVGTLSTIQGCQWLSLSTLTAWLTIEVEPQNKDTELIVEQQQQASQATDHKTLN